MNNTQKTIFDLDDLAFRRILYHLPDEADVLHLCQAYPEKWESVKLRVEKIVQHVTEQWAEENYLPSSKDVDVTMISGDRLLCIHAVCG